VLEVGDRFIELEFEETIGSILSILEKKNKLFKKGVEAVEWRSEVGLPRRKLLMLCSATRNTSLRRLADISMREGLYIKMEKGYADAGGSSKSGKKGISGSGMGVTIMLLFQQS